MDLKKRKRKINSLKEELFNEYVSAIKEWVMEKGVKLNQFINKLSIDISDYEIYIKEETWLDLIEYVPSDDKLYFTIFNEYDGSVYVNREFKKRDIELLGHVFCLIGSME